MPESPWDVRTEKLKEQLQPILEEFIRGGSPECNLAAFVVNVFAMNASGEILQETVGYGGDEVPQADAFQYSIESMIDQMAAIAGAIPLHRSPTDA